MTPLPDVTVVGMGADGWDSLPHAARVHVLGAQVLLGGERHLALVPEIPWQTRLAWPRPFSGLADLLAEHAGRRVVAVASGDPFVSGVGTTLARLLGDRLTVLPGVSSVTLARARLQWSAEETTVLTLVGRDPDTLRRELAPGVRILVLSADETTPGVVAGLLTEEGYGASRLTVLGELGAAAETRTSFVAADGTDADLPRLNVLAIEVAGAPAPVASWAAGLPDDAYEHDGQLTKRDVRASALSRLAPRPGALLWDVGAGAGSVAIEWLRAHPGATAIAVESDPDRAARITRNAARLGVPRLEVVTGRAPDALDGLPTPDAIFLGGGASLPGLLDKCRAALAPGGRLVAHGVTLETEQALLASYERDGGELTRLAVEHAAPLGGRFHGWQPARAVTQWTWHAGTVPEEAR